MIDHLASLNQIETVFNKANTAEIRKLIKLDHTNRNSLCCYMELVENMSHGTLSSGMCPHLLTEDTFLLHLSLLESSTFLDKIEFLESIIYSLSVYTLPL